MARRRPSRLTGSRSLRPSAGGGRDARGGGVEARGGGVEGRPGGRERRGSAIGALAFAAFVFFA
ncbi:MAG TPA: hypothetical protein RMG45_15995, partial [Polyangiaceae bacterium LLY-WYZ-15_(1-7)]|nr:hypothetical protein [Polyangiaceae bacterium LLY-WYZ-15_(1-7)]